MTLSRFSNFTDFEVYILHEALGNYAQDWIDTELDEYFGRKSSDDLYELHDEAEREVTRRGRHPDNFIDDGTGIFTSYDQQL